MIEYISDWKVTSCDDIVEAAYLIESQLDDGPREDTKRLANEIMSEVERRGYMFETSQIEEIHEVFERLISHGSMSPTFQRIDEAFVRKIKSIDVVSKLNAQLFADDLEERAKYAVGYDPKTGRITLRHGDCRIVL